MFFGVIFGACGIVFFFGVFFVGTVFFFGVIFFGVVFGMDCFVPYGGIQPAMLG